MNLKRTAKVLAKEIDKNSPSIYTGLAVGGVISTGILAVKAGYLAKLLLDDAEIYYNSKQERFKERAKVTWKVFIPTVISGGLTITAIILANHISAKRNEALVSLYAIAENTLHQYQDKVTKLLGEKKEEKLRDELAQDKLNMDPVEDKQIIITGKGDHLCYDELSGRYFKSDLETIRRCVNDFNQELWHSMFNTLNEFYDLIGLEPTELGKNIGWDVDNGVLEVRFTAKLASDGEPCIVLYYPVQPKFL